MSEEFYISVIGEVFDGCTEISIRGVSAYLKHVSIRDQRYIHKYYEKYRQRAIDKGVETEADRLTYIVEEELWLAEDDTKIALLADEIKNLEKTVKSLNLPSQKEQVQVTLRERREEWLGLHQQRKEAVGKTAEDYATNRASDELLRFVLFKDEDLTEHFYTEEEFENLESWEILKIGKKQEEVAKRFDELTLQKAVLRPFFSMYLSLCEDVGIFYRKPVTHLSIYQLKVALFGRMFFNVFQYTDDIPDHIKDDPEKLLAYADAQKKGDADLGIDQNADASAVFGATKQDMKSLGLESQSNVSLRDEAQKHGGRLDMKQMMRLAGHDV